MSLLGKLSWYKHRAEIAEPGDEFFDLYLVAAKMGREINESPVECVVDRYGGVLVGADFLPLPYELSAMLWVVSRSVA
jgi:hypothetical protein